jgi:hypothetical protein
MLSLSGRLSSLFFFLFFVLMRSSDVHLLNSGVEVSMWTWSGKGASGFYLKLRNSRLVMMVRCQICPVVRTLLELDCASHVHTYFSQTLKAPALSQGDVASGHAAKFVKSRSQPLQQRRPGLADKCAIAKECWCSRAGTPANKHVLFKTGLRSQHVNPEG